MAYNQYMHPRNIYRQPPDFKQLAIEFEEFRNVSKMDINGTITIDFKQEASLRALSKCLLKRDFQLDVDFPDGKLVPAIPVRLNYILWVEDLMETIKSESITGIDIGCGASCIYPLLAARKNDWRMYAIDIDDDSISWAKQNVQRNHLDGRITVLQTKHITEPFAILQDSQWSDVKADFTMCNPPFFNEDHNHTVALDSAKANRTGKRSHPSTAPTGDHHELATDGGEVQFVIKMIQASCALGNRIKVFSTMLGHRSSVTTIETQLKAHGINNYCSTAFCQGRTMRWAIAWTLHDDLPLRKAPVYGPTKITKATKKPFKFTLTDCSSAADGFRCVCDILRSLDDITINVDSNGTDATAGVLLAYKNTWSGQRQKKRAEMKRSNESNMESSQSKPEEVSRGASDEIRSPILQISLHVKQSLTANIELYVEYLCGDLGTNGAYQVLQYIINRWKER